jgi:hypothetical protein
MTDHKQASRTGQPWHTALATAISDECDGKNNDEGIPRHAAHRRQSPPT